MNTGLWNMASGFAAARRPGMTGCCVLFFTRQKERPPKAARLKEKEAAKGGLEAEGRMPMRAARSAEERVGQTMPDKHR